MFVHVSDQSKNNVISLIKHVTVILKRKSSTVHNIKKQLFNFNFRLIFYTPVRLLLLLNNKRDA